MHAASSASSQRSRLPEGRLLGVVPWDVRIAWRAAAVGSLAFSVAWLATAATDEGGIAWAERAGRVLPVVPACSAVGAWAVLLHAVVRGETLALAALGRREGRVALPAVLGAAGISLATSLVLASQSWIGLDGFYPAAVHASAWVWRGGSAVDVARGIVVGADADPMLLPVAAHALSRVGPPAAGRAAAALATLAAGLALPLLAAYFVLSLAHRNLRSRGFWGGRWAAGIVCVLAVGATAALFQSAAAARTPALLAVAPPLGLLAYAVVLFRHGQ
jgi:hypothetical protein